MKNVNIDYPTRPARLLAILINEVLNKEKMRIIAGIRCKYTKYLIIITKSAFLSR